MSIDNIFITHLDHETHLINQMGLNYARSSLYIICGILFSFILISFAFGEKKSAAPNENGLFSPESTLALKGLAIILLLLGHVSQQCVVGSEALPFRITGNAAVIIFLFVSGVGLAKKYHLQADYGFWLQRVKKIVMPVWLSLALFISLNLMLIKHKDPFGQLVLNFCCIFWTKFPDSPCWFITYILFLYSAYFLSSVLPGRRLAKLVTLFLLPFIASSLIIATGSIDHFILWPQYSVVFPLGVVCGLHASFLKKINDRLFNYSPSGFVICISMLLGLYWTGFAVYRISHLFSYELVSKSVHALINPVPLILFLILTVYFIEYKKYHSSILIYFGKFSFEIYLLHFPFIVYYDFLLFRKPLLLSFFIYLLLIGFLSILLQKTSFKLNSIVFNKIPNNILSIAQ